MPKKVSEKLSEDYFFYYWNEAAGEVRFVTSFDTVEKDIDNLVAAVETAMK
jgi:threonine aldolase